MSILSDSAILAELEIGGLVIDPFDPERLQPASYDLTLAGEFIPESGQMTTVDSWWLWSGSSVLASTVERVRIPPTLAGRLEGKSTWARQFVFVHAAGFVDPGFEGQLTLEIVNNGRVGVELRAGMAIAQLAFFRVEGVVIRPYGERGHYQNQRGPTPAWNGEER